MAFRTTWSQTMGELEDTFRKWGVVEWQTRPLRELDKRRHWETSEAKVELRFIKDGAPVVLDCGAHQTYAENLRVLYLAAEAMRMNEARGLGDIMRTAYLQLSAPGVARPPHEVLGIQPGAPMEVAEAAYRTLAKSAHPDAGGDSARMAALNEAIAAIRAGGS